VSENHSLSIFGYQMISHEDEVHVAAIVVQTDALTFAARSFSYNKDSTHARPARSREPSLARYVNVTIL
jgi:hypothetical protein